MIVIADAAPSNSEMFGYFIVFGLMFLLFLIGWLFNPKEAKTLAEVVLPQTGEGGGSGYGCVVAGCIVIGLILIAFMSYGNTHH